jgi:hypothetical protein
VEHTAIIGSDLRMVETVLGRLTRVAGPPWPEPVQAPGSVC